jgi:mRNA-degrading endonuclease toxin of MazEF toxin-antitoxin module
MRNLKLVLQREPAAVGSLVASILPVLVLLGVLKIDEAGIAAVVVAVNTAVGFGIRVLVSPNGPVLGAPSSAPEPAGQITTA